MVAEVLVRKYKNMNFKIPTYFSIVFKSGRNSGSVSVSNRSLPERNPKMKSFSYHGFLSWHFFKKNFRVLSTISAEMLVGSQMERSVSVWSYQNIWHHLWRWPTLFGQTGRTENCRSMLTNRFVTLLLFNRFHLCKRLGKGVEMVKAIIPLGWSGLIRKCRSIFSWFIPLVFGKVSVDLELRCKTFYEFHYFNFAYL